MGFLGMRRDGVELRGISGLAESWYTIVGLKGREQCDLLPLSLLSSFDVEKKATAAHAVPHGLHREDEPLLLC